MRRDSHRAEPEAQSEDTEEDRFYETAGSIQEAWNYEGRYLTE